MAQCLIENASEIHLVRKGLLREDDAKISTKPVQLEGVSGRRLKGGEKEEGFRVGLPIECLEQ